MLYPFIAHESKRFWIAVHEHQNEATWKRGYVKKPFTRVYRRSMLRSCDLEAGRGDPYPMCGVKLSLHLLHMSWDYQCLSRYRVLFFLICHRNFHPQRTILYSTDCAAKCYIEVFYREKSERLIYFSEYKRAPILVCTYRRILEYTAWNI